MGRMMVTAVAAVLCTLVILAGNASAVGPDKTITWTGGGKGRVLFDGRKHAEKGYVCKDCHHGLFSMKYGTAKITHAELKKGQYCGACHNGNLAFSTADQGKCFACHQGRKKKPEMHEEKRMYKQDEPGRAGKGRGTVTPGSGMPPPFER
jgi:c(7)-type cytochrome triheme protein